MNTGEEICGEWLRNVKKCNFIQYNFQIPSTQGEIDVIGINLLAKKVYICEVAVHLGGLQYVTQKRPDNFNRLLAKFSKDIEYAEREFVDNYKRIYMFWSPVVREARHGSKYNALGEINRLKEKLENENGIKLECIINDKFREKINQLRNIAKRESKALDSCVMRFLQIDERLSKGFIKPTNTKSKPKLFGEYLGYAFKISYLIRDKNYSIDFPDIPEIITSGSTLDEAFHNACEALDLHLESLKELGLPLPRQTRKITIVSA